MLASAFVARWRAGSKVETAVCFMCERTSRRRGLGRGCIGRREGKRDLARRNLGAEPVFLGNDTSEWWSLEQRSAVYHRAAAAKARRFRAEATTPRLNDGDAVSSQDETSALSSETPGR